MNEQALFTKISIPKSGVTITHQEPILLIGSCFSENVGEKLEEHKFNVQTNPFGILYNPISIVNGLKRIVKNQLYTVEDLLQVDDKWISLAHHSRFSSFDKKTCLDQINESITRGNKQLKKSKILLVTLGSAWVYEYPHVGIVANCHKIPNKQFEKRLLSVQEITAAFEDLMEEMEMEHPDVRVIFTVSPVRHTREGLYENNLSKSTLHLAIKYLVDQHVGCSYFPAYELVIDELRDYRFFKDDLVHPSPFAINYVWNSFLKSYCNEETMQLIKAIQKIKEAAMHRPFNFESVAHQQFIEQQLVKIERLFKEHSYLNFDKEKKQLRQVIV